MARAQYFVVLHDGKWTVSHEKRHYGSYGTQGEAIRAAVDSAHTDGSTGHDAQVLVQDTDGTVRTEWTYGHDPYPPPG